MLNLIDEFTHECLAIRVDRKLKSADVIDVLSDQFILRGVPEHIRSDNGPEFVAKAVQDWIGAVGAKTAYIERGSPWENGFVESFNARLRDELLDGEIFYSLAEARIVIESWRRHYNTQKAARITGLQAAGARGLHPRPRRAGGFATPTSAAARASREPNHELTFAVDQSLGAGHKAERNGHDWFVSQQFGEANSRCTGTRWRRRRGGARRVSLVNHWLTGYIPP